MFINKLMLKEKKIMAYPEERSPSSPASDRVSRLGHFSGLAGLLFVLTEAFSQGEGNEDVSNLMNMGISSLMNVIGFHPILHG